MNRLQASVAMAIAMFSVLTAHGQSEPIEDFVAKSYIHGVPKERAEQYGPEAVQRLHEMLDEPAYTPHLSNIIATLGYIGGNEKTFPLLKEMHEKHIALEGIIKPSDKEAHLKDALDSIRRAMARLGARGNAKAVEFLIDNCNVVKLKGREAFKKYDEQRFKYACRETLMSSMMALSVAGTEEAINALREIDRNAQSIAEELEASSLFSASAEEALTKAIEAKQRRNDINVK